MTALVKRMKLRKATLMMRLKVRSMTAVMMKKLMMREALWALIIDDLIDDAFLLNESSIVPAGLGLLLLFFIYGGWEAPC